MTNQDADNFLRAITQRYGADATALTAVMCPLLIPIKDLNTKIFRTPGQPHYRASFSIDITEENWSVVVRGRTGKFVPAWYGAGGSVWKEIAKGRIINVDHQNGIAHGEIYVGGTKATLASALNGISINDYLEIDQYGASAKILSGLAEYYLLTDLSARGYWVQRMPEDMARHLGSYANFDFMVHRDGKSKRVEVKSLWGTDTRYARLIHSTTTRPKGDPETWSPQQVANYYPTSSCRFTTQDFFAVSLFLRTGNIRNFAFARSVPIDVQPHGLPRAAKFPDHVNQNPLCGLIRRFVRRTTLRKNKEET